MKRITRILALTTLGMIAAMAHAQISNPAVRDSATDPTGVGCTNAAPILRYTSGGVSTYFGCTGTGGTVYAVMGGGGSGTVNAGITGHVAYYPANGTAVSGASGVTTDGAGGLTASTVAAGITVSAPNLPYASAQTVGAGNFIPSINNPMTSNTTTQNYMEVESNGTCENLITRSASQTWYTTATDAACESWASPTLVSSLASYNIPSFGVTKVGATYYMAATVSATPSWPAGGTGTIKLFSSASLSGPWTLIGTVFTASVTSSDYDYYIYNPTIISLGSVWWLSVDVGNGGQGQLVSYATGCATGCDFNTHASSATTYVLPVGSPQLISVPDSSAVVILAYDNRNNSAGYNGLTAYTISSASDPTVATNWTRAPGFLMWYPQQRLFGGYLSDPRLYFSPTLGLKAWNAILTYTFAQTSTSQAYSNLTLDQWYSAITNPFGAASWALNMPTFIGPYTTFSNPTDQGYEIYYRAGASATSPITNHFQTYLGADVFTQQFDGANFDIQDITNGMYSLTISPGETVLNASTGTGEVRINSSIYGGGTVGNSFNVYNGNPTSQFGVDYRGDLNVAGQLNTFKPGEASGELDFQPGVTADHNYTFVWKNSSGTVQWTQTADSYHNFYWTDNVDGLERLHFAQGGITLINAAGANPVRFNSNAYGGGSPGTGGVTFYSGGSSPTLVATIDAKGAYVPGVLYSAAGTALPTCNSGEEGAHLTVSDATTPTYLGTYASGGAVVADVLCNGTNWVTH